MNQRIVIFCTFICLPAIAIASPNWLKINGIGPCWPVIWLLPFSVKNGPFKSSFAAVSLGFLMDSFTPDKVSYVPSLLFLSLVWGRYGLHKNIELLFNVGFLAILGTAFVGFSIYVQKIIIYSALRNNWFYSWSMHLLISEIIITGLVAPFFSSWLLLTFKKY